MSTAKWTITFNADNGHATQASGCGPATAVYGTAASFTTSPDVFSLDGSPDLSAVTTNHVLWVNTSTGRKFFTIASVDNTAKTVTVNETPTGTTSGLTWAIGGKRVDPFSDSAIAADALAGWTIELEGGTTAVYNAGDSGFTFSGTGALGNPILMTGASRGSKPVIHFWPDSNGYALIDPNSYTSFRWLRFECQTTNAVGATQIIKANYGVSGCSVVECEVIGPAESGSNYTQFFGAHGNVAQFTLMVGCYLTGTGLICFGGQDTGSGNRGLVIAYNHAENVLAGFRAYRWVGITFAGNIVNGSVQHCLTVQGSYGPMLIANNTLHGAGTGYSGIDIDTDLHQACIVNNSITGNAGYGINMVSGALNDTVMMMIANNQFGTGATANGTGDVHADAQAAQWAPFDNLNSDPGYANQASGDMSPGANNKAAGYPATADGVGMAGLSTTYNDIGAVQRQEPTGGGGLLTHPGMSGGMRG